MSNNTISKAAGSVASALGKGVIAGLAGTAAITLSQTIEMKITGRKPSTVPAKAASKVLQIKAKNKKGKKTFSQEVHWMYGTSCGIARSVVSATGLKGLPATLAHFAAVLGTALIMEPALKVAPPVKEWKPQTLAVDALHHAVYATVAGLVYDAIE